MNDFLDQWQACPRCSGACGYFEVLEHYSEASYLAWQTCDLCKGEGVVHFTCPSCGGSGVNDPDHP